MPEVMSQGSFARPHFVQWHKGKVPIRKTPHEQSSILVILSKPLRASAHANANRRAKDPCSVAWWPRESAHACCHQFPALSRKVTGILRAAVMRLDASARSAALRMTRAAVCAALRITNARNSRPRPWAGPFSLALRANFVPLPLRPSQDPVGRTQDDMGGRRAPPKARASAIAFCSHRIAGTSPCISCCRSGHADKRRKFRPAKREKSASKETSRHPLAMAKAARYASVQSRWGWAARVVSAAKWYSRVAGSSKNR